MNAALYVYHGDYGKYFLVQSGCFDFFSVRCCFSIRYVQPCKHEAFTQCCFYVGTRAGQHQNSIGWIPRVCRECTLCATDIALESDFLYQVINGPISTWMTIFAMRITSIFSYWTSLNIFLSQLNSQGHRRDWRMFGVRQLFVSGPYLRNYCPIVFMFAPNTSRRSICAFLG